MNNKLLNNIATQIVADKVMDDKMKDYEEDQVKLEQENLDKMKLGDNNDLFKDDKDDDDDIFGVDSDEERVMKQEREKRMGEMGLKSKQRDRSREKKQIKNKYGDLQDIEESNFLDHLLKADRVVCHFYHNEFERCKIMDKHLKIIAQTHPETLFCRINADKAPFFTTKLNIQVLPTVLFSKDGKVYDRQMGFEGLGEEDDFSTLTLTRRMVLAKIITAKNKSERGEININKPKYDNDSDSDY